jgi:hypothetical protein
VPGPDNLLPPGFGCLLAYGPAPGVELIPYFLGMVAWAGLALSAIFLAPLLALFRRLRRTKDDSQPESTTESMTASVPESPGDGSPDQV